METTSKPTLVHRAAASALWAVALTLLIVATVHPIMGMFAWALFASMIACVSTGWIIVEQIVHREQEVVAVKTAAAVARAIADDQVSSIR